MEDWRVGTEYRCVAMVGQNPLCAGISWDGTQVHWDGASEGTQGSDIGTWGVVQRCASRSHWDGASWNGARG